MNAPTRTIEAMGNALAVLNQEVALVADEAKKGSLPDALRTYHRLRAAYEALDEPRKALNEMIESLSRNTIPEMMADADVKTITCDVDGTNYRFTVAYRFSCSMIDKARGYDWLRANGLGGIIVETVNSGTLGSAAKDLINKEGRDMPSDIFKTGQMAYTSATKVA